MGAIGQSLSTYNFWCEVSVAFQQSTKVRYDFIIWTGNPRRDLIKKFDQILGRKLLIDFALFAFDRLHNWFDYRVQLLWQTRHRNCGSRQYCLGTVRTKNMLMTFILFRILKDSYVTFKLFCSIVV